TMTKTGKVSKLKQHIREPQLEIHNDDAERLGTEEGQLVEVTSRRGHVRVKATIGNTTKPEWVLPPRRWGNPGGAGVSRANNLTNPLVDPISKEPDFKFCAVQVALYRKKPERIVIVGAGAGAFGFVKAFREINKTDEITVFSNEDLPFYNRVMLPH